MSRSNTIHLAPGFMWSYVACRFCRMLKPTQDMELHVEICGVRLREEKGYLKLEDLHKLLYPRAYGRTNRARARSISDLRSSSRAATSADQPRYDQDSEHTLVDEVSPAPLFGRVRIIAPNLADRFPVIEPQSPQLPPVDWKMQQTFLHPPRLNVDLRT